ncbi:MAG: DUF2971 domain-containing protein [Candidatus Cloacimonadales bacterium]
MNTKKLYKFISSNEKALTSIVAGNIKFTTIDNLNDPTDLFPRFDLHNVQQSLIRLRKDGFTNNDLVLLKQQEELFNQLAKNHNIIGAPESIQEANCIIKSSVYNNTDYLREAFEMTVSIMKEKCGLFCLTERNTCLPMWAHYAENAKGFVIEFTGLKEQFNNTTTGVLDLLLPVNYETIHKGVTFETDSYKTVFTEKNIDWGYEKEWRVATKLSNCTEDKPNHLMKIDKKMISKVIFGWKVNPRDVKRISQEIRDLNSTVRCVVAEIRNGEIYIPE